MTKNVVNLNKVRKAKNRVARKQQADENAVKFGRTKAEKAVVEYHARKERETLDGKKRDQ